MAAPKFKTSSLSGLYPDKKEVNHLRDKQAVEALRERLNQKIQNDPELVRKAALILEQWLNPKKQKA